MTWFEVFYDLIIAATISRSGDILFLDTSWEGSSLILGATLMIFTMWLLTAMFYAVSAKEAFWHKPALLAQTMLLMVAALATGDDGLENWVGVVAIGGALGITVLIYWTARGPTQSVTKALRQLAVRVLVIAFVLILPAVAAGMYATSDQARLLSPVILLLAVAALLVPILGPFLKGLIRERGIDLGFLEERFESLVLIAVGEMSTRLVLALTGDGEIPSVGFFVLTFVLTFSVWAVYSLGISPSGVPTKPSRLRLWIIGHAFFLFSAVDTVTSFQLFTVTDYSREYLAEQVEWSPLPILGLLLSVLVIMASQRAGGLDGFQVPQIKARREVGLMSRLRAERSLVLRLQVALALVLFVLWLLFYLRPTTGVPWYSVAGAFVIILDAAAIAIIGRKRRKPSGSLGTAHDADLVVEEGDGPRIGG